MINLTKQFHPGAHYTTEVHLQIREGLSDLQEVDNFNNRLVREE